MLVCVGEFDLYIYMAELHDRQDATANTEFKEPLHFSFESYRIQRYDYDPDNKLIMVLTTLND